MHGLLWAACGVCSWQGDINGLVCRRMHARHKVASVTAGRARRSLVIADNVSPFAASQQPMPRVRRDGSTASIGELETAVTM